MRAPLGQNFLVSPRMAERIVESLGGGPHQEVVEIGPGRGALTQFLLLRQVPLTAVELDARLAVVLKSRWGHEPLLTVVSGDFLKWPFPVVNPDRPVRFIGNLPYSVAAAIVQRVLAWNGWDRAVFMVQKEVGARMSAAVGEKNWGLLALSVQSRSKVRRLWDVPPGAFRPAPKVVSTVLEFERLPQPRVRNLKAFFEIAHLAFAQRRKTVAKSLSQGLQMDRATVEATLKNLGVCPTDRPDRVSLEQWDRLATQWGDRVGAVNSEECPLGGKKSLV